MAVGFGLDLQHFVSSPCPGPGQGETAQQQAAGVVVRAAVPASVEDTFARVLWAVVVLIKSDMPPRRGPNATWCP